MKLRPTTLDAYKLFHEGVKCFAQIEANGVRIDTEYLDRTYREIGETIQAMTHELYQDEVWKTWQKRFGAKAKLGNRQQLASIVFDVMGYKSKGEYTTRGHKADEVAFDHVDLPFVKKYVQLMKFEKIHGTYLTGLRREVTPKGLIHAFINLHIALSYRSSMDHPNLQNVPVRLEMMREIIRRCFIPRDGHVIVEFDFKGVEVCISCCSHFDPNLISYVKDKNRDMHRDTAMELFFLKQEEVDPKTTRHFAKNKFVFPQFYGDYYASCAKAIWEELLKTNAKVKGTDITIFEHLKKHGIHRLGDCDPSKPPEDGTFEKRVKWVEDQFWNVRFPVYTEWKKTFWEEYQKTGVVKLPTGFLATGVYRRNQILNLPIQGPAFHCDLWCIIELQKWLRKHKFKSMLVNEIHDSAIGDFHEKELDDIIEKMETLMRKDVREHWPWIIVPLEAEVEVAPPGKSWLDKGKYIKKDGLWQLKT